MTDIRRGFPSDSNPYTEQYDYLSDSNLEDADGSSLSEGEDEEPLDDYRTSQGRPKGTPGTTTCYFRSPIASGDE